MMCALSLDGVGLKVVTDICVTTACLLYMKCHHCSEKICQTKTAY